MAFVAASVGVVGVVGVPTVGGHIRIPRMVVACRVAGGLEAGGPMVRVVATV